MTDSNTITEDRERFLNHFVEKKFEALTVLAVEQMRAMPGRMSGDDSGLADPFEEHGFQLYDKPSIFIDFYELEAENICSTLVEKLAPLEVTLLGAFTDGYLNVWVEHDDVAGVIKNFRALEVVTRELYGRLQQAAIKWYEGRDDDPDCPDEAEA